MADEKIPSNGGTPAPEEQEQTQEFTTPQTPEAALGDLVGSDAETFLLPSSSKAQYFFAYDALLDQGVVSRYVRGLIPAKVVRAANYRIGWPYYYPPEGTSLPTLVRSGTESVWGLVYDAKGCDFARLERHLNCPNRYHRRAVQVLDRGDRRFSAFTYVLSVYDDKAGRPSAAYLAHLVETAKERGLPAEWIAQLEGLETTD
jgi:hypothetical protein